MKLNKKLLPLSVAAAMAALTACQVGVPTKTTGNSQEVVIGGKGDVNVLKPGQVGNANGGATTVQTNPILANPNTSPNATINGRLVDMNGKPVAGATVTTLNGQKATTDADGNYTIRVGAEAGKDVVLIFQKDGYIYSSDRVTMSPGESATLVSDLKVMDPKVNAISAATGGTFSNSTGVLEIDVTPGSLSADVKMNLTPLSFGGNGNKSELPGPLETVDESGNRALLMPVEYWSIDMSGGTLKPGESMTMRMKLPANPLAPVKLKAGDLIPCYIYDAQQGFWNSPNLGPIVEKDGALWATYEIKGSSLTDRVNPTAKRAVAQVYTNCSEANPCTEQQLIDNAAVERAGAANVLQGSIVQGISGGHTYYNLYGSNIVGHAYDFDGQTPLNGVTVSVSGGAANGRMNTSAGKYSILEYRNQRVTLTANAPGLPAQSKTGVFTETNPIPLPRNQFGRTIQYENTTTVTRGNQRHGVDTIQAQPVAQLLRVWTNGSVLTATPEPTPTPSPSPSPSASPAGGGAGGGAGGAGGGGGNEREANAALLRHLLADINFTFDNNIDNQNSTQDAQLDVENRISWGAKGPNTREPAPGSTYQVKYLYPPTDLRVEGRMPERVGDHDFVFDTRHPLTFQLSGLEAASHLNKLTVKLDGVDMLVNDARPTSGYLPLTGPNATGAGVTVNDGVKTIATATGVATRGKHSVSIQIGEDYYTKIDFDIPSSQAWGSRVNVPVKMFSMGAK